MVPGESSDEEGREYGVAQANLDGLTVGDVNEVNLILLQNGVRAHKNDAGRQKSFRGAGYHSRAICSSGARIGNIMDYFKVLLVRTGFLWQRTFQDENSHFAEDADTSLTFWIFINSLTPASLDYSVTRTFELPVIFTTSSVFKVASILNPASITTTTPLFYSPTISTAKLHEKSPFSPA